ncbi:MAG: hypothetical protein AB7V13_22665 [Pseudorhodoplanes sp.]|uniref:hypothetical protein n=1 Tax=Pseudorhodoplanes sp. TaxID=1934341 RepID=UPI003D0DDB35
MNDENTLLPSAVREHVKRGWTAENEAELADLDYRWKCNASSLLQADKDRFFDLQRQKRFFESKKPPAAAVTQAALPRLPRQKLADADEYRKEVAEIVADMCEFATDLTKDQILDSLKAREDLLIRVWNNCSKNIRDPFRAILSVLINNNMSLESDRLAARAKRVALEERVAELERGGAGISIEGTFDATRQYARLAVVALGGASFIAKYNNPGPCPGDGWQLFCSQGKAGKPGPRGGVRSMQVDGEGMFSVVNADGSIVKCDFYSVLAKVQGSR